MTASVIQGFAIDPAIPSSFVVTTAYLRPKHHANAMVKFADDTHLIVPTNSHTCDKD